MPSSSWQACICLRVVLAHVTHIGCRASLGSGCCLSSRACRDPGRTDSASMPYQCVGCSQRASLLLPSLDAALIACGRRSEDRRAAAAVGRAAAAGQPRRAGPARSGLSLFGALCLVPQGVSGNHRSKCLSFTLVIEQPTWKCNISTTENAQSGHQHQSCAAVGAHRTSRPSCGRTATSCTRARSARSSSLPRCASAGACRLLGWSKGLSNLGLQMLCC